MEDILLSLRLRSTSALLRLEGWALVVPYRTLISEKEAEDCRKRGRRVWVFGGGLSEDCVAVAIAIASVDCTGESSFLSASGAGVVSCVTHSSDRSSSHGWAMLGRWGVFGRREAECC